MSGRELAMVQHCAVCGQHGDLSATTGICSQCRTRNSDIYSGDIEPIQVAVRRAVFQRIDSSAQSKASTFLENICEEAYDLLLAGVTNEVKGQDKFGGPEDPATGDHTAMRAKRMQTSVSCKLLEQQRASVRL